MALEIKIPTLNANGGQRIESGIIVRFKIIGEFGSNNTSFELKYNLDGGFGEIQPVVLRDIETENGIQESKLYLPRLIRCNKTITEIEAIMDRVASSRPFIKAIVTYHLLVKEQLDTILGADTVIIRLDII